MRRPAWISAADSLGQPFWGKRVSIQVFDKKTRVWKQVQTVKLTEQGGGGGGYVWTSAKFRPQVPRNVQLRGFAGYSNLLRR